MIHRARAALFAALVGSRLAHAAQAPAPAPADPRPLDRCDALVRDHPESFDSYLCYWTLARKLNLFDDAAGRLEARLRTAPLDESARLYLGIIRGDQGRPEARDLLRSAADRFQATGDLIGEVYARISLVKVLRTRGAFAELASQLDRAEVAANASGDAQNIAQVAVERGWQAYNGSDLGQAYGIFREVLGRPGLARHVATQALFGLGSAAWATSRGEEALAAYRRLAEMHHESGNPYQEASARLNVAFVGRDLELPPAELRAIAFDALRMARAAGNPFSTASAEVLAGQFSGPPENLAHFEQALEVARGVHDARNEIYALGNRAFARINLQPPDFTGGLDDLNAAVALAERQGRRESWVDATMARREVLWATGDRERAFAETSDLLRRIDDLVERQPEDSTRGRYFSRLTYVYKNIAGCYFEGNGPAPTGEDITAGFEVLERMRARSLVERMQGERAGRGIADPQVRRERAGLLERIATTQRKLLSTDLPDPDRRELLAELDRLEADELAMRERIARADPAWASRRTPTYATLAQLQATLDPDEAFVSYSLHTRRLWGRGSWILMVTRTSARALSLPDVRPVARLVDLFRAMIERRDGGEGPAAAAVYDAVLAPGLRDLPPGVRRLIIVPDEALWELPFDLLRASPDSPVLASRFEITMAPSATVWMNLHALAARPGDAGTLALADPEIPAASSQASLSRDWRVLGAAGLGALPYARGEVRNLRRALGAVVVREGRDASERFVKTADLSPFQVIHFAAHAIVDQDKPERSAVVLTPGGEIEDGLLQAREISDLDLRGRLIVLSACRSASGEVLRGEGVLGLTHAFFEAGARAVVGTLWPVRDDDASDFFSRFYEHLGKGVSVAAAMTATRDDLASARVPGAAWGGFVVAGDGSWVPFPAGRAIAAAPGLRWATLAGTGLGAAALVAAWFLSNRGRG